MQSIHWRPPRGGPCENNSTRKRRANRWTKVKQYYEMEQSGAKSQEIWSITEGRGRFEVVSRETWGAGASRVAEAVEEQKVDDVLWRDRRGRAMNISGEYNAKIWNLKLKSADSWFSCLNVGNQRRTFTITREFYKYIIISHF